MVNGKYDAKTLEVLSKIFDKIEVLFPEHKIFAFSSIIDDARESLAKIAKQNGLSGYEEILNDFGYVTISADEVRTLRPKVNYSPGNEPDCIKSRVQNLLKLLDKYYPDKIIENSIQKEHKKVAEKLTGLYLWLGYDSRKAFLVAYGYDYRAKELCKLEDYTKEVIEFLKQKYSRTHQISTISQLYEENPNLVSKIKNIYVNAQKLFGMEFGEYLISIGVLADKAKERKDALEAIIEILNTNYPSGTGTLTLRGLYRNHPKFEELTKPAESECERLYGKSLQQYLREIGILKSEAEVMASKYSDFEFNQSRTQIVKYTGNATHVVIPSKINTIGKEAFANSNVVEISLEPNSALKHIDNSAFENCHSLIRLDFSNSAQFELKIDEYAFKNCENLEDICGEWDSVYTRSGAFEGCVNCFVYDGEYTYPRLWLYKLLISAENGRRAFDMNFDKITGGIIPRVILTNRYTKRQVDDEYYVTSINVPIAADAGYGNTVVSCDLIRTRDDRLEEIGLNRDVADSVADFWSVFYLPTNETVKHFLKALIIGFDQYVLCEYDEFTYREKQHESFKKFIEHYAPIWANLKKKPDYDLKNLITTPAKKMADVTFIGHQGYQYRCPFDAKVGDIVYVDGTRAGDLGIITSIVDDWSSNDSYYKDIVKAFRQPTKDTRFFKKTSSEKKLSKIYDNLGILERQKRNTSKPKNENAICGKNCCVLVEFGDKTYKYNSPIRVHIGDLVSVTGKLEEYCGYVVEIIGPWDDSPYMQQITRVMLEGDNSNDTDGAWIPFDFRAIKAQQQNWYDDHEVYEKAVTLNNESIKVVRHIWFSYEMPPGEWYNDNFEIDVEFLGDFEQFIISNKCNFVEAYDFSVTGFGIVSFEKQLTYSQNYIKLLGMLNICDKTYNTEIFLMFDPDSPINLIKGVYVVPLIKSAENSKIETTFRFDLELKDGESVYSYDDENDITVKDEYEEMKNNTIDNVVYDFEHNYYAISRKNEWVAFKTTPEVMEVKDNWVYYQAPNIYMYPELIPYASCAKYRDVFLFKNYSQYGLDVNSISVKYNYWEDGAPDIIVSDGKNELTIKSGSSKWDATPAGNIEVLNFEKRIDGEDLYLYVDIYAEAMSFHGEAGVFAMEEEEGYKYSGDEDFDEEE